MVRRICQPKLAGCSKTLYNTGDMPDVRILNLELGGPSLWPYFRRAGRFLSSPYLSLLSRIALGGLFIFAGASKLGHVGLLVTAINRYQILSPDWAEAYGHVLPPLELILGMMVVLGLFLTFSSFMLWLLLMSFAIAKIAAIIHGLNIEACSCLGPSVPLMAREGLILDFVLLLLAAQIIFRRGDILVAGPPLWKKISNCCPRLPRAYEKTPSDANPEN